MALESYPEVLDGVATHRFGHVMLRTLALVPVSPPSSILYVGPNIDTIGGALLRFARLVKRIKQCRARIDQVYTFGSLEEYIFQGDMENVALIVLDVPCHSMGITYTNHVLEQHLGLILEEGGIILVTEAHKDSCGVFLRRSGFGALDNDGGTVYLRPIESDRPSFSVVWRIMLTSSVLAMELEGWKTFFAGMGHIGEVRAELQALQNIVRPRSERTHVCEVGFNSGHSAIAFLSANSHVNVTSFDIGGLPWSSGMVNWVKLLFPGRFSLVHGNTADTLPRYGTQIAQGAAPHCDVVFIDRDHTYHGVKMDLAHSMEVLGTHGGIILADDYSSSFPGVVQAWSEMEADQRVVTMKKQQLDGLYSGFEKGWVLGKVHVRDDDDDDGQGGVSKTMNIIHVATTHCGTDVGLLRTLLKSIIISCDVHDHIILHLVVDGISEEDMKDFRQLWESAQMEMRTYSPQLAARGVELFKPCAMERLLLPQLLDEPYVIYLDRDTLVMQSLWNLYTLSSRMQSKAMGMVAEGSGWYFVNHGVENSGKTYVGATGVNSGVLLMNLNFMRDMNLTETLLSLTDSMPYSDLGDQDVLNYYFAKHSEYLFQLPCKYNYRVLPDGIQKCTCDEIEDAADYEECLRTNTLDDAAILHGNKETFFQHGHVLNVIWTLINTTSI